MVCQASGVRSGFQRNFAADMSRDTIPPTDPPLDGAEGRGARMSGKGGLRLHNAMWPGLVLNPRVLEWLRAH